MITVSHDRYFLDNVVNRIMAFEGDGQLVQYEGGYTDYLEAKARKGQTLETRSDMAGSSQNETPEPEKKKSSADTWKQNRKQKLKFTYKEQKEFETIDDDIAALEDRLEQIDKEMAANATNAGNSGSFPKNSRKPSRSWMKNGPLGVLKRPCGTDRGAERIRYISRELIAFRGIPL